MGVSCKLSPVKLRPQTPKLISLPATPRARCASVRGRKSRGKLLSCLLSFNIKIMEGDVLRECAQRLMQAAEQIQIGQNSLTARNNTGARRGGELTQTASGPESVNSTTSPRSALSAAGEVQETLKGLRIRLVQPGRSTGKVLVIGRRLGPSKRKLAKSSVSSLALYCNLLDRSSREFLSRAKTDWSKTYGLFSP